MKRIKISALLLTLLLASCAAAPAVTKTESDSVSAAVAEGTGGELTVAPEGQLHADTLVDLMNTELSDDELAGIAFMREEEKLARDVYLQLADTWGLNIFSNIARSEETHMEAVLSLIELAGAEDPAQGLEEGEFLNPDLQQLYDDLLASGKESLDAALLVGAAIEEIDILDLQEYLQETENAAVKEVYQNLLHGSIKHLQSFVSTYERQSGEAYQPQYLSEDSLQELLAGALSRGGGGGRGTDHQTRGSGQPR
jgi:hypothetical protein